MDSKIENISQIAVLLVKIVESNDITIQLKIYYHNIIIIQNEE